jgi:putative redox protein
VKATVRFTDGLQFVGEGGSGHAIVMDGDPRFGGHDTGLRPTELLLIGLGGCTGMDVVSILRKKRQPVAGLTINVTAERSEGHPARLDDFRLEFVVKGTGVDDAAVKRAVELSMEKYCSVKFTLEGSSKVDFTYRIEEGGD